ncbi:MAG TPA: hypothetical protein VMT66_15080 [Steroidobacteraceae bacterium]|nr:hypothetical protein [Steroidobacteraceae bacterium]
MSTRTVDFSRFVAAASATVITAVSSWAFVSSSVSIERDPFQFASVMAANARVRTAQLQNGPLSACANNPEIRDHRSLVCLRG